MGATAVAAQDHAACPPVGPPGSGRDLARDRGTEASWRGSARYCPTPAAAPLVQSPCLPRPARALPPARRGCYCLTNATPQPLAPDDAVPPEVRLDRAAASARGVSALAAHPAPQRPTGPSRRAGLRAPFLDRHQAGFHQVRAREEPRHLLAVAAVYCCWLIGSTTSSSPAASPRSRRSEPGWEMAR